MTTYYAIVSHQNKVLGAGRRLDAAIRDACLQADLDLDDVEQINPRLRYERGDVYWVRMTPALYEQVIILGHNRQFVVADKQAMTIDEAADMFSQEAAFI